MLAGKNLVEKRRPPGHFEQKEQSMMASGQQYIWALVCVGDVRRQCLFHRHNCAKEWCVVSYDGTGRTSTKVLRFCRYCDADLHCFESWCFSQPVAVANALNDRIVKMSNDQCSYTRRIDELVLAYSEGSRWKKRMEGGGTDRFGETENTQSKARSKGHFLGVGLLTNGNIGGGGRTFDGARVL